VIVLSVAAVSSVAAACAAYRYWRVKGMADRSTTSSAGGGPLAYETSKAVDEYLQMHFASAGELLPYPSGPLVR
jgi:hypothetical protein